MQLNRYLLLIYMVLTACYVVTSDKRDLLGADIVNDAQALTYCKQTQKTYIAIVWPKGYAYLDYITKTLNQYGLVTYVKRELLNKRQMFSLYRALHKSMSYETAKKYFKPYIDADSSGPLYIAALVFYTEVPLEKIIHWKKEIRDHIGESYYSLHINDYYYPGTLEAANAVFKVSQEHNIITESVYKEKI